MSTTAYTLSTTNMRTYQAYEILAKIQAGLVLGGQDDDGDLEWIGTRDKWQLARYLEDKFENAAEWDDPTASDRAEAAYEAQVYRNL